MGEYRVLLNLLNNFAPQAVEKGYRSHADEDDLLADRRQEWTGERIYHYRTRMNRALLWLSWSLPASFGLLASLSVTGWARREDVAAPLVFCVLAVLFSLWRWWRYRAARVVTDALGITQYAPFAKRSLA